jgi:hypothetical protein
MDVTNEARQQSTLRTLYYWMLFFVALTIADDATFGWIFWLLAQINPLVSAAIAFTIYWTVGYWITLRGLAPESGRLAGWFLKRLQLDYKNPDLHARQEQMKSKITSVAIAAPMSLLFGGVVTTLWLHSRQVVNDEQAKKVALWLCAIYAVFFATVHALGIGGSIFFARH